MTWAKSQCYARLLGTDARSAALGANVRVAPLLDRLTGALIDHARNLVACSRMTFMWALGLVLPLQYILSR